MKRTGKIALCLAGGLMFSLGLQAADNVVLPGNPYAPIVARNIFGLVPIPVVDPSANQPDPPVKITANGIMSIFGNLQVLFKTSGGAAKPGQPAKEQSYVLSIGQRQDDIEVVKIDEKKGVVTFNNHGLVQDLALTPVAATPAPAVMPGAVNPAATTAPGMMPNNGGNNGFGRFGNRGGNNGGRRGENGGGSTDGSALRNVPTRNSTYQPSEELPQMSPEVQTIAIEAQREKYKAEGNPAAALLPPTALTPAAGDDGN